MKIRVAISRGWTRFATAERRAAWYLLRRGFLHHREPAYVVGRKPDFLTFGRGRMWVEVKSLDPPVSQEFIGKAFERLKQRFKDLQEFRIDAWVSSSFDDSKAKSIRRLVYGEIRAGRASGAPWYASVPADLSQQQQRAEIRWTDTRGRPVRMVTWKSAADVYTYPLESEPGGLTAEIRMDGGIAQTLPAYELLSVQLPAPVMLRVEPTSDRPGVGSVGTDRAQEDTTVDRLRRVIDDANDQLKNGQRYEQVPGVVQIFFDHLGGAGQNDVLRACFGDLTIPIDATSRVAGEAFYGRNGILRADKNTAISAVTYRPRHYGTVSILNPWATYPVPLQWIDGTVHKVDGDRLVKVR